MYMYGEGGGGKALVPACWMKKDGRLSSWTDFMFATTDGMSWHGHSTSWHDQSSIYGPLGQGRASTSRKQETGLHIDLVVFLLWEVEYLNSSNIYIYTCTVACLPGCNGKLFLFARPTSPESMCFLEPC